LISVARVAAGGAAVSVPLDSNRFSRFFFFFNYYYYYYYYFCLSFAVLKTLCDPCEVSSQLLYSIFKHSAKMMAVIVVIIIVFFLFLFGSRFSFCCRVPNFQDSLRCLAMLCDALRCFAMLRDAWRYFQVCERGRKSLPLSVTPKHKTLRPNFFSTRRKVENLFFARRQWRLQQWRRPATHLQVSSISSALTARIAPIVPRFWHNKTAGMLRVIFSTKFLCHNLLISAVTLD